MSPFFTALYKSAAFFINHLLLSLRQKKFRGFTGVYPVIDKIRRQDQRHPVMEKREVFFRFLCEHDENRKPLLHPVKAGQTGKAGSCGSDPVLPAGFLFPVRREEMFPFVII